MFSTQRESPSSSQVLPQGENKGKIRGAVFATHRAGGLVDLRRRHPSPVCSSSLARFVWTFVLLARQQDSNRHPTRLCFPSVQFRLRSNEGNWDKTKIERSKARAQTRCVPPRLLCHLPRRGNSLEKLCCLRPRPSDLDKLRCRLWQWMRHLRAPATAAA